MNRTIMIKPSSSLCNLHCHYCFYLDETKNRKEVDAHFMSDETRISIIRKALSESDGVQFCFQGGEPSLVGEEYYRAFFETVKKENTAGKNVQYAFQTNGFALSDGLLDLFKAEHVLMGISLDGPRIIHDQNRKTSSGDLSFRAVMENIARIKAKGIEFNILSVVTDYLADNFTLAWDFFQKHQLRYLQFIPCLAPLGSDDNQFLSANGYLRFLNTLFPLWRDSLESGQAPSVRLFDNFLSILMGLMPEGCGALGICSKQYVVEGNGSVFPCDFYCLDEMKIGNILTDSFDDMDKKRKEMKYLESSLTTNEECKTCRILALCGGGCRRYRDKDGKFVYCEVYKQFLDKHLNEFLSVAQYLMKRQEEFAKDAEKNQ